MGQPQVDSANGSDPSALLILEMLIEFLTQFGEDVLYVEGWGWLVWTDIGWQHDTHGTACRFDSSGSAT